MTKNKGCLDCKIRHINCHDSCEDYKNFKKELQEIKEKKKKDNFIIQKVDRRNLSKIEVKEKLESVKGLGDKTISRL